MNMPSYSHLSSHSSVGTQAVGSEIGVGGFVFGIACLNLDWGEVSQSLSSKFLASLIDCLKNEGNIDNILLSNAARHAFSEACRFIDPDDTNSKISGEFVATYYSADNLNVCWIGRMFATAWHQGVKVLENQPHNEPTSDLKFAWTSKFFRRTIMSQDSTIPDAVGPYCLIHPTIVYVGNWAVEEAFQHKGGDQFLRGILCSIDVATFKKRCQEADEWLKKVWAEVSEEPGFQSMFLFS